MGSQLSANPLSRRAFLKRAGIGSATIIGADAMLGAYSSVASAGTKPAAVNTFGTASIALSWVYDFEFAGEFAAESNGYFEQSGFAKVNLLAGGGQTSSWDAVLANQAVMGYASDLSGVGPDIQKGAPLKVIGAHYVRSPVCFVSLQSNPIRSLAELKGKSIGVNPEGQATIIALLKVNGLPASYVNFVSVPNGLAPLETKKVDALIGYATNYPIALAEDGYPPVVLSFADCGYPVIGDAMVVTEDSLKNNRDLLKALVIADIKGWIYALQRPAKAVQLALKYGKANDLTSDLQTKSTKAQLSMMITPATNKNGLFTLTDKLVAGNVKAVRASGTDITASQLFDLSLLQEIYKENPDLLVKLPVPAS